MTTRTLKELLSQIYAIVHELETMYPGRKFTPDGHMVGSLGEVLAEEKYDIELLPTSTPDHDAVAGDGKYVQIRTTQKKSAPLKKQPDHLIVQKLHPDATVEEIFNGPGDIAWELTKKRKPDKNGQFNISLGMYAEVNKTVPDSMRIKMR